MTPVFAYFGSSQDWLILLMPLLGLFLMLFTIVQLVDAIRRQFPEPNLKIIWVLVILLMQPFGAILYLLLGRRQGVS